MSHLLKNKLLLTQITMLYKIKCCWKFYFLLEICEMMYHSGDFAPFSLPSNLAKFPFHAMDYIGSKNRFSSKNLCK